MRATTLIPARYLAWALPAFLSPSILFLVLMVADRCGVRPPPEALVTALFYSMPLLGLLVCGRGIWLAPICPPTKFVFLTVATGAMVVQFAILLALMLTAAGVGGQ